MTLADLDAAAISFLNIVIAVALVAGLVGILVRKPERHIRSAEFRSSDVSHVIRKGK